MSAFELFDQDGDAGLTVIVGGRGAEAELLRDFAQPDGSTGTTLVKVDNIEDLLAPPRLGEASQNFGPLATGQCESLIAESNHIAAAS